MSSIIAAHIQLWRRVNQTWAALKPLGSHYNDDIQNRVSEFCCTKKTSDLTLNIYVLLSIFKLAVNFFLILSYSISSLSLSLQFFSSIFMDNPHNVVDLMEFHLKQTKTRHETSPANEKLSAKLQVYCDMIQVKKK